MFSMWIIVIRTKLKSNVFLISRKFSLCLPGVSIPEIYAKSIPCRFYTSYKLEILEILEVFKLRDVILEFLM